MSETETYIEYNHVYPSDFTTVMQIVLSFIIVLFQLCLPSIFP